MNLGGSVIKVVIVVCLVMFALTFFMTDLQRFMFETFALYYPQNENFRFWQFVTNIFMHGGFAHIFFNMYALWAFGTPLEKIWGSKKFVIFFFLAGIGAAVVYILVNYFRFESIMNDLSAAGVSMEQINSVLSADRSSIPSLPGIVDEKVMDLYGLFNIPVVGASGAIYGVLVAFGMLFPNAKLFLIFLPVPIAAKYFIPALIAMDLFSGVTGFSIFGGGIAHFGHVGGALIGFILMWIWSRDRVKRNEDRSLPEI